jgi:CRISPR system Cascade subunit CasC
MKHLELHTLQSFPVACLNRDDLNSPKTAIFGGVQRARVSSQSWKRAIRELAKELSPLFNGQRTRLIVEPLKHALITEGFGDDEALENAKKLANEIAKLDAEAEKKKGKLQVKTLFFTSPEEIKALAQGYRMTGDPRKTLKRLKADFFKDAADIALFGRMVANDHSLSVEGAAMFGHALSTHKVDNEIDFFSAVDERQDVDDLESEEEAGAGMMGTLEFNSATYYRFAALNLDMLKDADHLGVLSELERREVVRTFVRATLTAVPGARKNSMNAATLPGFVLGVVRKTGHPIQLVNAFEKPLRTNGGKGLFQVSVEALKTERERINSIWGLETDELACPVIPEKTLVEFLDEVIAHVE